MSINGLLDNFVLPEGAAEAIAKAGLREQALGEGVSHLVSGHDRGLPYRFFVHEVKNELKSKLTNFPHYDQLEMIEWIIDRDNKPVEQARKLPEELLRFDSDGECLGGEYAESYKRWKEGLSAPGLSLSKWGVMSDAEVRALSDLGIYTVEMFAAQSRDRIRSKFPSDYMNYFEAACQYVNGKDRTKALDDHAEKIAEQALALEKANETIRQMQEQMAALMSSGEAPKKRGRPRKVVSEEIESEE